MTLLLFLSLISFAQSEPRLALKAHVIEIAPYGEIVGGKPTGIYVDFFKLFERETGEKINIQVVPFTRAIHDILSGTADLLMTASRTDVDEKAQRVCQPFTLPSIVFSPRETFKSWSAIENKKIIRIRGGCQDVELKMKGKIQFIEVKNVRQGLVMLYANRGDGLCADIHSIRLNLKRLGKSANEMRHAFQSSVRDIILYASAKVPADTVQKLKAVCEKSNLKKSFLQQLE